MLIDTERYRDKAAECVRMAHSSNLRSEWLTAASEWEAMAEVAENMLALEVTALELVTRREKIDAKRT
jgi:hypothetical protein